MEKDLLKKTGADNTRAADNFPMPKPPVLDTQRKFP